MTELIEPKGHKTAEEKSTKETTEAVRELEVVPGPQKRITMRRNEPTPLNATRW